MRVLSTLAVLNSLVLVQSVFTAEYEPDTHLRVVDRDGRPAVSVLSGDSVLLTSPGEGLWSLATAWQDGWPTDWSHVHPKHVSQEGPWTILKGALQTDAGIWRLRDAYRPRGRTVECVRRWAWHGDQLAEKTTLAVRWQAPQAKGQALLPGILYDGNPSGATSKRTPIFSEEAPVAVFEEHRYPLPYASLEWMDGKRRLGAALHSLPAPVPSANLPDQWWSLGVDASRRGTELILLSGPCASNGKTSVIKAIQPGFVPYDSAYLNVAPTRLSRRRFGWRSTRWIEKDRASAVPCGRRSTGSSPPK